VASVNAGYERSGSAKRLDDALLYPGDIVLTTTTAAISKAIRMATRSDISHAMVYVENCSVIDATGEGVHARNT
jgi:cell wall-associated NlpC family hydrolase